MSTGILCIFCDKDMLVQVEDGSGRILCVGCHKYQKLIPADVKIGE